MDNEEGVTEQIQETLQSIGRFQMYQIFRILDPILIDPKKKQIKRQIDVSSLDALEQLTLYIHLIDYFFLDALIAEKNIEDIKSIKSKQPDIIISKNIKNF